MLKKYLKSESLRNVSTLVSGTVLAQIIPILLTPILSRIYTPQDFGFYGFYLSIISVFAVVASGRFHLALFIANRSSKAVYILKTSILVVLIFSSLISVGIIISSIFISRFSFWYYFVGLVVFNATLIEVLNTYANTKGDYKIMSSNMIIRSIIANFIFIILGVLKFGEDGLMIGLLLGQILQLIHFYFYYQKEIRFYKINSRLFRTTVYTYKNFLIHSSSSALLNNLSIQLPTFFLKNYYNIASVGQYFQSYKLLTLPNSFVAKAFGSVFVKKAADRLNKKEEINDIVLSLYKNLVFISFIPFSILAVYGDIIFSVILGEQWAESGVFAQIISPWVYINFIVLPFTYLFEVFQRQKHFSIFNLILLTTRLVSLLVGYYYKDIYLSILLFSISSFIVYSSMLIYLFNLTKVKGLTNYFLYIIFFIITTLVLYLLK